jgi:SulP family sulfate permease
MRWWRPGLAIIYLFPLMTKPIPSPLVTIIVLTVLTVALGWDVRTVGDMGELPDTLPVFLLPDIPLTLKRCRSSCRIQSRWPVVGLLESLMTQNIVDDLTDTTSNRNQECVGQGLANTATGLHWRHGRVRDDRPVDHQREVRRARRLSSFCAGVFLLIMVVAG